MLPTISPAGIVSDSVPPFSVEVLALFVSSKRIYVLPADGEAGVRERLLHGDAGLHGQRPRSYLRGWVIPASVVTLDAGIEFSGAPTVDEVTLKVTSQATDVVVAVSEMFENVTVVPAMTNDGAGWPVCWHVGLKRDIRNRSERHSAGQRIGENRLDPDSVVAKSRDRSDGDRNVGNRRRSGLNLVRRKTSC